MTLTTHAAIGAAIGSAVGNPALGFVLGAASHFLVDMIPHGDNQLADLFRIHKKKRKLAVAYVTVDAVLAMYMVMTVFLVRTNGTHVAYAAAVAGSILPDLLVGLSDLWRISPLKKFCKFHFFFHDFFSRKYGDFPLKYALLGQAIFIAVLLKHI
ncbi:MAG: hypothetical protein EBS01_16400 [Verrucomicrobia bacterium]|nr:hypothetical protein [Verrucomicrobiota bacterium]